MSFKTPFKIEFWRQFDGPENPCRQPAGFPTSSDHMSNALIDVPTIGRKGQGAPLKKPAPALSYDSESASA